MVIKHILIIKFIVFYFVYKYVIPISMLEHCKTFIFRSERYLALLNLMFMLQFIWMVIDYYLF